MNLKNLAIALIIALLYEILVKVTHILASFLFDFPFISSLTGVLFFVTGAIVLTFFILF